MKNRRFIATVLVFAMLLAQSIGVIPGGLFTAAAAETGDVELVDSPENNDAASSTYSDPVASDVSAATMNVFSSGDAYFHTDFTDSNVGTWKQGKGGNGAAFSDATIITDPTATGGKALQLAGTSQDNPLYNIDWPAIANGTFTARIKSTYTSSGNVTLGLSFRTNASGNPWNGVMMKGAENSAGNRVFVETNTTWSDPFGSSTTPDLVKDKWYITELSFNGTSFTLKLDGEIIAENANWVNFAEVEGYLGFRSWGPTQTYVVDWVEIRKNGVDALAAPTITGPVGASVPVDETATFTVAAIAADGVLAYQWQRSTGGDFENIAGATATSYTTAALTLADDGAQYRCVVTLKHDGKTSISYTDAAALTVTPLVTTPIITKQPVSVVANAGTTAKFEVTAGTQSGDPVTYNWQVSTDGSTWSDAAGTHDQSEYTTPVLTTGGTTIQYRCQVFCNAAVTVSAVATVTVAAAWPTATQPVNTTFSDGDEQLLTWYKIGTTTPPSKFAASIANDPSAVDGKVLRLSSTDTTNHRLWSPDLPTNITDGEYAVRIKGTRPTVAQGTDEVRFGLIFRHDESNGNWHEFTRSGPEWVAESNLKWDGGHATAYAFTPGQWHTLRVIFVGNKVTAYFDGEKILDLYGSDKYYLAAGGFGLRSFYAEQDIYIDSLYVGPIRSEDDLPEDFKVSVDRPDPFVYERTYADNNTGTWMNANTYEDQTATIVDDATAADDRALKLNLSNAAGMYVVDTDASYTKNATYSIRLKSVPEDAGDATTGGIALVTRYESATTYAIIYYNPTNSVWDLRDANNTFIAHGTFGKGPEMLRDTWYDIRVRYVDGSISLFVKPEGGEEIAVGTVATNAVSYPKVSGLVGVGSTFGVKEIYIDSLKYTPYLGAQKPDPEPTLSALTIASADMSVEMDNRFPVPRQYTFTSDSAVVSAQQELGYMLKINGEPWLAEVVGSPVVTSDKIIYTVRAYEDKIAEPDKYVEFTFTYIVEGTTLNAVISADDSRVKLYTFEMPNISLASFTGVVGAGPKNSNIRADGYVNPGTWNNMSDLKFNLNSRPAGSTNFSAAFISNTNTEVNAAVGLYSDSTETPSRNIVTVTADDVNDLQNPIAKTLSINAGGWVYRGAANSIEFPNAEADFPPPSSFGFRVVLARDNNGDGSADWQDAANLYREYVPVPKGGENIRDYFTYVSFNFNSLAQNYFLRGLDDGKKLYNYTDGFGQMILEKGYQAEGHDDSHPDVGNHIGIRQGGSKDFNTLINEGKKYNMKVGVHVNVGEYILDAYFNPPLHFFNTNSSGYPNSAGWGWVDQAFYFDQTKDLVSGELDRRFSMLKSDAPNLDWVYVDIYSGADWRAKQVGKVLKSYDWMHATEFSGPMEQDVVWTHWGTDLYYPTSGDGSQVFRYLYNNTKDAFPTSSPAVSSMLRGSVQPGIATWQNRTSIAEGVRVFYNQNLASKYMQYFPVWKWTANEIVFGAPTDDSGVTHDSKSGARSVLDGNTTKIYAPDGTLVAIMDHTVGGDGKLNVSNSPSQVFIPWNPITEDKIYYWNAKTGADRTTIWELPDSWNGTMMVTVYELTDTGRITALPAAMAMTGSVDLSSLKSNTPYVIYKLGDTPHEPAGDFGAVEVGGGYLADPGFDTHSYTNWQTSTESNVTMKNDARWNGVMEVGTAASTVTNEIVGLTPGKTYTASVWLQIGEGAASDKRNVTLRVTDSNGTDVSTTAVSTTVRNYDEPGKWKRTGSAGQANFSPYPNMTRIEVRFVADTNGRANFILEVEAGTPVVTFDDARVWENPGATVLPTNTYYYEDFENVSEGYGPFVYFVSNGGGQTHLAEKAAAVVKGEPTNQYENYVIEGMWSLKTYESSAISTILRTTPNTVAFAPGTEYTVTFDYSTAVNNVYVVKAISGSGAVLAQQTLAATGAPRTDPTPSAEATLTFTTPANDADCYITVGTLSAPGSLHTNFLIIDTFTVKDNTVPPTGTYTVTFNANDGSAVSAVTVSEGDSIASSPATTRSGYTFGGWFTDNSTFVNRVTFPYRPSGDITLYAKWTQNAPKPPTNPPINPPVIVEPDEPDEPDEPEVIVTVPTTFDEDGVTTGAVGLDDIKKPLEQDTTELTLNVEAETGYNLEMSAESLEAIAGTEKTLVVTSHDSIVRYDNQAMNTIARQSEGKSVAFIAEKQDNTELSEKLQAFVGDRPMYKFEVAHEDGSIKDLGNGAAYISIPYTPEEGENLNAIIVYDIDEDGEATPIRGSYNPETGTVDFKVDSLSTYAIAYKHTTFDDVSSESWYYDAVTFAAARDITLGVGNNEFNPYGNLTREQFLVMIMRAYGVESEPDDTSFEDVEEGAYYSDYIAAARAMGITNGVGANQFGVGRAITRQEMFTMLYNLLGAIGDLPPAREEDSSEFSLPDSDGLESWAIDATEYLIHAGVVDASDNLNPANAATRASMVQLIYNLLK